MQVASTLNNFKFIKEDEKKKKISSIIDIGRPKQMRINDQIQEFLKIIKVITAAHWTPELLSDYLCKLINPSNNFHSRTRNEALQIVLNAVSHLRDTSDKFVLDLLVNNKIIDNTINLITIPKQSMNSWDKYKFGLEPMTLELAVKVIANIAYKIVKLNMETSTFKWSYFESTMLDTKKWINVSWERRSIPLLFFTCILNLDATLPILWKQESLSLNILLLSLLDLQRDFSYQILLLRLLCNQSLVSVYLEGIDDINIDNATSIDSKLLILKLLMSNIKRIYASTRDTKISYFFKNFFMYLPKYFDTSPQVYLALVEVIFEHVDLLFYLNLHYPFVTRFYEYYLRNKPNIAQLNTKHIIAISLKNLLSSQNLYNYATLAIIESLHPINCITLSEIDIFKMSLLRDTLMSYSG